MDKTDTLDSLKALVADFCNARDWGQFHSPDQLSIGLITEAAELLELFRFKSREQVEDLLRSDEGRQRVQDELADIFFFLLRFGEMNNIDLASALTEKLKQNEIKYPVEKVRGKNLKYNEL